MRAMKLRRPGGLDRIEAGEADTPAPGFGDIRVRLHATSLNYHDYAVVRGMIQTPDGRIPMSDGAGEVTEIGPGVTAFALGDKVIGTFYPLWRAGEPEIPKLAETPGETIDGFAREEIVAPASAFTAAPAGYSDAEAATLPCAALTAWRALFVSATLRPGETVLVQGTGGVSIFALQFAKAAGARIVATSSSDEKLERLRALGADHLINYKSEENWGKAARAFTGGRGVDHVVEIGGAGTLAQSVAATRLGGHIALIGVLAGHAGSFSPVPITLGNVRISGISVGSHEHQTDMIRAIEANGIRPVIDRTFPLENLADAFRYQESGAHFGKICCAW